LEEEGVRKSVFLYTFLSILLLLSIVYIPVNAQTYDIQLKTDKTAYNYGDTVNITGNVTRDGTPVDDAVVAVEIDSPYGNPYVIRTVQTGEDTSRYWRINITELYTCDSGGNPKTLFNKGQWVYVAMKIRNNMGGGQLHVKVPLCIQYSDGTPLTAFYTIEGEIDWGQELPITSPVYIPDNAVSGQATIFAGVFSDSPKVWNGSAYCKEKTASFYIGSTTPPANPQPQYFNMTFAIPQKDPIVGEYTIYASSKYVSQVPIRKVKQFKVLGPVPIMTYYPTNPIVSQTVTFNGSASYARDGRTITDWDWQFGDDTIAAGAVVNHIYEVAGNYIARLTVTDNDGGSNSTTRSITVLEAWPMFHHDPKHSGSSTSLAPVTNITTWSKVIGPINTDFWMYPSAAVTPAIMGNAVFIGSTNGTIFAFDATSGGLIWKKTLGSKFYSSPAFADGLIFIGSNDGHIYALNATNGNTKYSIPTGGYVNSSAVVVNNRVYIGSQDKKVYAFYTNGTNLWISDPLDGAISSSPVVANGKVFVGTWNGTVYALNEITKAIIWRRNLTPQKAIYSSPAFASGKVFVGSTDKTVYALNAETGTILWSVTTGGEVYSSPAVANGVVFVGSMDNNLYALNVTAGALIWSKTIGPVKWSSPLVAEGKVFIGTANGKLYALREKNGEIWWSYQTSGAVDSSPAVLNDTLYASSKDGKLYAFHSQTHDIAITSVTPSKTLVKKCTTAIINAILWNKGTFNDVVNVKASYNSTVFYSASITLTRGEERLLPISWDTTSVPTGNYVIHVNATLTSPIIDGDPSNNNGTCQIRVEFGDISIANVTPSSSAIDPTKPIPIKNVVGRGYNVTIYLTIKNKSNFTESNIQVTVYWSNTTYINQTIGSTSIPELAIDASVRVNITWNTNGIAYGNYTISAYAWPVIGELNTTNNMFISDVPVHVGVPGDISSSTPGVPDGITNIRDINYLVRLFLTKPKSPNWNPNADVNNDGVVNIRDINIAVINFLKKEQ
jgi:outer membrane protein assembly factor BamB